MLKMFELYSLYNTSGAKCVPSDHFICFACMCVHACKCACLFFCKDRI